MRKIVSGLFVSLDGVGESPDQWQFAFDEEMGAELARTLEDADTVLLGRVTYLEWSEHWPNVTGGDDAAFASWINNAPKYVFSSTLDNVDAWENSTLVKGDPAEVIRRLKSGEGKDIAVAGSLGLVRSLVEQDLLDELVLLIHPVIAGEGRKKLFAADGPLKKLELVSALSTSSGVIIATYRPA